MDLQLAIIQSCTETTGVVQTIESNTQIAAVFADPIIEFGITLRPHHLVAVDHSVSPPQIVFRWALADVLQVTEEQLARLLV